MEINQLKSIIQAALMASGRTLNVNDLLQLFQEEDEDQPQVNAAAIKTVIEQLQQDAQATCFDLKEIASGYCYQIRQDYSKWLSKLWEERPPRYSRALLETLVITAYRQPVTRADIEDIRGVAVSSSIMKTLLEREWLKVIGHRDLPGKPGIYGTTKAFLDYFNLKNLDELPTLEDIKNIDEIGKQLNMPLEMPVADEEPEQAEVIEARQPEIIQIKDDALEQLSELVNNEELEVEV